MEIVVECFFRVTKERGRVRMEKGLSRVAWKSNKISVFFRFPFSETLP